MRGLVRAQCIGVTHVSAIAPAICPRSSCLLSTLALLPLLLLAACGGGADEADDTRAAAPGEVLESTISDAMLPLDRLRSQPPLLAAEPVTRDRQGGSAAVDEPGQAEGAPADQDDAGEIASAGAADDDAAVGAAEAPATE